MIVFLSAVVTTAGNWSSMTDGLKNFEPTVPQSVRTTAARMATTRIAYCTYRLICARWRGLRVLRGRMAVDTGRLLGQRRMRSAVRRDRRDEGDAGAIGTQ